MNKNGGECTNSPEAVRTPVFCFFFMIHYLLTDEVLDVFPGNGEDVHV